MTRFRSVLATLRIANAPSVVSNVWLGFMLALTSFRGTGSPWLTLALLSLSALCLYFAGNLANDWFDREWDRRNRPERALPSGHFRPSTYLALALFLAINGCLTAASLGTCTLVVAIVIVALISLYTWLHKRTRWAVIPMGLCRAGLYVMGFLAAMPREHDSMANFGIAALSLFIGTHALGLLIYIAGLSLAARYESVEHPPHGMILLSRAMLFLPLAAMSAWWMNIHPVATLVGMLPFAVWLTLSLTRFRRPIPRLVSALLAGIPLIDFIAAVPVVVALSAAFLPRFNILGHPLLVTTLLIPLVAFVLGRLLQKVAPAT